MGGALRAAGERGVLVITHDRALLDGFDRVLASRRGRIEAGLPGVASEAASRHLGRL